MKRQSAVMMVWALVLSSVGMMTTFRAAHAAPAESIDGSTWVVTVTPDTRGQQKGEKPFEDKLTFKEGKMTASECVKHGFEASDYIVTQGNGVWNFSTEQVSSHEGRTKWSGKITGDRVRGSMRWMKPDGGVVNYSFEGRRGA